jgi:hypothetical protein
MFGVVPWDMAAAKNPIPGLNAICLRSCHAHHLLIRLIRRRRDCLRSYGFWCLGAALLSLHRFRGDAYSVFNLP